ncbi:MAG TPA: hypothetical protein PKC29_08905 [Thermodesulfobacteriota bacterium]|mgnify:CR=1 FL=1|nr:hypothetical protein [Thermodesulfobacteriota bacterium]
MPGSIPESIKQFADPSRPKELRLMAARGLVPASPGDLSRVLYYLTRDEDEDVSREAGETLSGMPSEVVSTILTDAAAEPGLLDFFARALTDEAQLQRILLNASATDETVAYLAERVHDQNIIDLIANNHERIARSNDIVEALSKNPLITRSTMDAVIEFLKLYMGDRFDFPSGTDAGEDEDAAAPAQAESGGAPVPESSFLDDFEIDEEFLREEEAGYEAEEEPGEEHRSPGALNQNAYIKISVLNVGQRIKLALLGNREARAILVKDPNRIVSRAVLKNPRITDTEVVQIAQSKIVSDEILREISDSRKWTRLYQVKLALVTNPKTPPHISIGFLKQLREFDLRNLRWNKNVSGVVATAVKHMMKERNERK